MTKKVFFVIKNEPIGRRGKYIKRSKTPVRRSKVKYYTQKKAQSVGKRIELEMMNGKIFNKRLHNELFVEKLLIKNRHYSKINKIYRLSNSTLYVLKQTLTKKMNYNFWHITNSS